MYNKPLPFINPKQLHFSAGNNPHCQFSSGNEFLRMNKPFAIRGCFDGSLAGDASAPDTAKCRGLPATKKVAPQYSSILRYIFPENRLCFAPQYFHNTSALLRDTPQNFRDLPAEGVRGGRQQKKVVM